jgi:alkylation response protein AidB-like acyl-CoA dehydrogenase
VQRPLHWLSRPGVDEVDLAYSSVYREYVEEVREFLRANWPVPGDPKEADKTREFRCRATRAGHLYRTLPPQYGGAGLPGDLLKSEIVREEFRKVGAPREIVDRSVARLIPTLLQWGTEWQKQHFIPPTLGQEMTWCQGYSEPNAGSDLASLRTLARPTDGVWLINGSKIWSSNADRVTHMHALVRTEPEKHRHLGISYLFVELHQPGVEIRPIKDITGATSFCEVFFTDAVSPDEYLIGGRGNGWAVSRTVLRYERNSMRSVEWLETVVRRLARLAAETTRDGGPAIREPAVRSTLARIDARLYSMRYSTYRDLSMEAVGEDSGGFRLMMKLYLTITQEEIVELARNLLGDDNLLRDPGSGEDGRPGSAKWVQHAMDTLKIAIAGGSSNIQRNIIGERVLGLPRDPIGPAR